MKGFRRMEEKTKWMDKPIGLPALLVWMVISAGIFFAACLYLITAAQP